MSPVENNSPHIRKDLVAMTIYGDNHLFYLLMDEWDVKSKDFIDFFQKLSLKTIYLNYGKKVITHLRKCLPNFSPSNIADHAQMAKVLEMKPDLDTLSQHLFREDFCKRTYASPREIAISVLRRQHILMEHELLFRFIAPLLSSDKWEIAEKNTIEIISNKKSRGTSFRQKK